MPQTISERADRRFERVCVALEAASTGREALDAAAGLAVELDAELAGFFVEDVNVLRAAALPFTRELDIASGVSRPMQLDQIERAVRAQAQAAQSLLARIAEDLQLRWSFTTIRGAGIGSLLMPGGTSLTVVSPRSSIFQAHARIMRPTTGRSRPIERPVAVPFDGTEESFHLVHAAVAVANSRGAPLLVLLRARDDRDAAALRETLEQTGACGACEVRYGRLPESLPAGLAAAARQARAAAVIVGTGKTGMDEQQLSDLLDRLDCPLIVVS